MQAVVDDPLAVFADAGWRADLALVVQATAQAARQLAADAQLLVGLAARVPAPVGTGEGAAPWQSFLREIAVARGIQDAAALREVGHALLLCRHLPRTLERLAHGELTVGRARALLDELLPVDPEVASAVDRELADRVQLLPPTRIRHFVRRAVDRHDADAAAARGAVAARSRGIRRTAERDGQAGAVVTGPAVPLARWFEALTEAARAQRAAGDLRGVDALRFDLLVAGFTAPDEPPACAPAPPSTPPPFIAQPVTPPPPLARPVTPPPPLARPVTPPPVVPRPYVPQPLWPTDSCPPASDPSDTCPAVRPDPPAPDQASPCEPGCPAGAAGAAAAEVLAAAREQAAAVLAAAHAGEAAALRSLARAQAEADRLTARTLTERLACSQDAPGDRRRTRPVQVLIHVPVATALGLTNEPGWLEGHGWLDAPTCRQLLPMAELRQVCVTPTGRVLDLSPTIVRPEPTPTGVREALLQMATDPFTVTDAAWREQPQHDPSEALAELVRVRDRFCDGPTGLLWPASRSDLDHGQAHPEGPTAAWNLAARSRRTHRLKHRGWSPVRTVAGTTWFSPAGQVVQAPNHDTPAPEWDDQARLPDPDELHALEAELVRVPTQNDDPPAEPPF